MGFLSYVNYSYLVAEGMEKTFKFTQDQIVEHVDEAAARKVCLLLCSFCS